MSVGKIKVIIVDDHELVRCGIRRLLEDANDIDVIGEAESGEEAVRLSRELKPNVVLMDVKMPGIGGLEATKKLRYVDPDIKVIAVTVYANDPFPSRFLKAGAKGYLTKNARPDEILTAIRKVNVGQRYLSPEISDQLAFKSVAEDGESPFDLLSERELQIMLMITRGLKVQDISGKLCLSPKTVNSYRYRLFDKLKITNDVELTHLAIQYGMLDTELFAEG